MEFIPLDNEIYKLVKKYGSDDLAQSISYIYTQLDVNGVKDYIEELENWTDVDEVNIDPIQRHDAVINIAKKYALQLLKRRGIILDNEKLPMIPVRFIVDILIASDGLLNMDIGDALYIEGILNDCIDNSNLDKLYLILFYFNPNINTTDLMEYVEDVPDALIEKIRNAVTAILTKSDITMDGITEASKTSDVVSKIVDRFIKLGLKTLPETLELIINDPYYIVGMKNNYDSLRSGLLKKFKYLISELENEDSVTNDNPIISLIKDVLVDLYILAIINKDYEDLPEQVSSIISGLEFYKLKQLLQDINNKIRSDILENEEFRKLFDRLEKIVYGEEDETN